VLDRDVVMAPSDLLFETFLADPHHGGRIRHVVVTQQDRLLGVARINTALRHASRDAHSPITMGDIASRDFIVVGPQEIMFEVIERMWREHAFMAVVARGSAVPRSSDVLGVISKEHVANSVADSIAIYPS
jgi:CIC family chloride channel protein